MGLAGRRLGIIEYVILETEHLMMFALCVDAAEGAAGSDRLHVRAQSGQPPGPAPRGALGLRHPGRSFMT